jgi:myosin heavy subunit
MWSVVRSTAARQLRVGRAATSRVANSFTIPTAYRVVISRRNFTETRREFAPKSDATETKPKTRRASTAKEPKAKKSKAATTKKAAKAKKPKVKKAAPKKKRVKKVLTPEEKIKLEIRELKKKALLNEPKKLPDRSWMVYVSQHLKNNRVSDVTSAMKDLSASYKDLAASELEVCRLSSGQGYSGDKVKGMLLTELCFYSIWRESQHRIAWPTKQPTGRGWRVTRSSTSTLPTALAVD